MPTMCFVASVHGTATGTWRPNCITSSVQGCQSPEAIIETGSATSASPIVYNVLNSSGILGINTTYGSQWRRPLGAGGAVAAASGTAILDGRLIEVSGQLTF